MFYEEIRILLKWVTLGNGVWDEVALFVNGEQILPFESVTSPQSLSTLYVCWGTAANLGEAI